MDEFLDYWQNKWPGTTRNLKVLEQSAHFRGCRDAWFAARQNNADGEKTPTNNKSMPLCDGCNKPFPDLICYCDSCLNSVIRMGA